MNEQGQLFEPPLPEKPKSMTPEDVDAIVRHIGEHAVTAREPFEFTNMDPETVSREPAGQLFDLDSHEHWRRVRAQMDKDIKAAQRRASADALKRRFKEHGGSWPSPS